MAKTPVEVNPQARSRFFEKKRGKKNLLIRGRGAGTNEAPTNQKFFGSFFQKRTP
jgi:hypothetical protein